MKGKQYFLFASLLGALLLILAACGGNSSTGTGNGAGEATGGSRPSNNNSSLADTWQGNCTPLNLTTPIQLNSDGTGLANSTNMTYTSNGTQITLTAGQYSVTYNFALSPSGNALNLSDLNGNFCTLGRQGSNAQSETAQAIVGMWTSNNVCQGADIDFFTPGVEKMNLSGDGTDTLYTASDTADQGTYSVRDAGDIVFHDSIGNSDTFALWVTGSTLEMKENSGGPTYGACTFQKS